MNILNKLTIKNLRLNKRRTIVTIIGIILSGAMICGSAAIITSFQDLLVESTKLSDGNYHATFYNVAYENTKYIKNNVFTDEAMLFKDIGYASLETTRNKNKPYLFIKSYDKKALENMPIVLKDGRFPEGDGEIVVSYNLFTNEGSKYSIGETITVSMGNRRDEGVILGQNTPLTETEVFTPYAENTFTITGIIEVPRGEYYFSPGYTAISYLDETPPVAADENVNVSIISKNPKKIFDKAPEIAEASGASGVTYNNELLKWMGISQNKAFNSTFITIALIIILLVVIGSVTVIYNAFAISVSERKKQFGMLASVGATASQIRRGVFFEGLLLGLIGIPIGVLSGFLGIGITIKVVNRLMTDSMFGSGVSLRLIISPTIVLTTVVFVALTIFLSAFIPAKRASKITPIEAIRLNTDIKIKGKSIKTSKLTRYIFGIEGELALKNLKRNRRRYRATVFSLFISIVLFVSFSSFMTYGFITSEMYYGDNPYDMIVMKDSYISSQEAKELFEEISEFKDVDRYSIVERINSSIMVDYSIIGSYLQRKIKNNEIVLDNANGNYQMDVNFIALNDKEYTRFLDEAGINPADLSASQAMKGILINKNIISGRIEYEPLNIKKGEILEIQTSGGTPLNLEIEVVGTTEKLPFGVTYASMASVNIVVPEESYLRLYDNQLRVNEEFTDYIYMAIQSVDISKLIIDVTGFILENDNKVTASDISNMQKELERTKTVIAIFLYGFVALITLIGVTNIFNTISTNVALRRREFAMLKSVGLTPAGFNKMINYESIFYGLKALLYGLPISALISLWMYNSIGNLFEFEFVLPWREIGICIAGVFIIVFITMMYSSSKLKKENIIDALKEENL